MSTDIEMSTTSETGMQTAINAPLPIIIGDDVIEMIHGAPLTRSNGVPDDFLVENVTPVTQNPIGAGAGHG